MYALGGARSSLLPWTFCSCGQPGCLVAVCRLLIATASLVKHRLQARRASVAVAPGAGYSAACGTSPEQGLNLRPCLGKKQFLPTVPPGSPLGEFLMPSAHQLVFSGSLGSKGERRHERDDFCVECPRMAQAGAATK